MLAPTVFRKDRSSDPQHDSPSRTSASERGCAGERARERERERATESGQETDCPPLLAFSQAFAQAFAQPSRSQCPGCPRSLVRPCRRRRRRARPPSHHASPAVGPRLARSPPAAPCWQPRPVPANGTVSAPARPQPGPSQCPRISTVKFPPVRKSPALPPTPTPQTATWLFAPTQREKETKHAPPLDTLFCSVFLPCFYAQLHPASI